jgi:hypothetical protein
MGLEVGLEGRGFCYYEGIWQIKVGGLAQLCSSIFDVL